MLPHLLLIVALAIPLLNPIGYVGGASDDVHYLEAARCWVDAGLPCVPSTHWATRWPAIAPIAAFTALFGESRLSVGLGPGLAWLGCILLVRALGRAWFDEMTGAVAAVLFAAIPAVTQSALQPSVDTTELVAQLGALWLADRAFFRQSRWSAIAAGAVAAISVQARDTSIIFCAVAALAWLVLDRERRRVLLWALVGFAVVEAAEIAIYFAATGDPLFRYRLALHHVALPSAELSPALDTSRSPLFNRDYIAGWRRDSGIGWWWPADPWLNLIASPRTGFLFAGMLIASAFGWITLPPAWKQVAGRLLGCALLVSAGLIYALAIDPKPRMFFALSAVAALTLAAIMVASLRVGRGAVPTVVAVLVVVSGARILTMMINTHALERQTVAWVAAFPGEVEIDPQTRSTLALVPQARALAAAGSGRPLRIAGRDDGCEAFALPIVQQVGARGSGMLCLLSASKAAPRA